MRKRIFALHIDRRDGHLSRRKFFPFTTGEQWSRIIAGVYAYRKLSLVVTRIKARKRDWSIQNVIKSFIHARAGCSLGEPFLRDRLLEVNPDNARARGLLFLPVTFLPFLLPLVSASTFIVSRSRFQKRRTRRRCPAGREFAQGESQSRLSSSIVFRIDEKAGDI